MTAASLKSAPPHELKRAYSPLRPQSEPLDPRDLLLPDDLARLPQGLAKRTLKTESCYSRSHGALLAWSNSV